MIIVDRERQLDKIVLVNVELTHTGLEGLDKTRAEHGGLG
jgi:hypothetical protein